ncbi:MAG: CPBP family intramembrane glutamic endopeptidase [Candidatus Krumholzibacteriia bacterium]
MREILADLRRHFQQVNLPLHLALAGLLAGAFVFNYTTGFKQEVMNAHGGQWVEWPLYLAFYGVPFYGVLGLQSRLTGRPVPRARAFWWTTAFAMLVLAANRVTLTATVDLAARLDLDATARWYVQKCLVNVTRTAAIVGPLWLLRRGWGRREDGLYGLAWRRFAWRPFAAMLAIMAPLILWASFQPAFLTAYPIYDPWRVQRLLGWPVWLTYPVHEVCYALRFVGVELFFRGFLVIGLARWLGRDALLPMVVLYAMWHFGKPMPEALGSVFGGYILGIIAYESRCVLGGILVHMGIALMMNAAALWREWPG